mgnify:CR=1 FL=1
MKIKYKFNKDKLWFTSDNHWMHENIIKYCARPFKDVIEMNQKLVENWNNLVQPDDDIIVAGDFIHSGNLGHIQHIINSLNGRIWLVYGNHCYQNKLDRPVVQAMLYQTCDALDMQVEDDELEDGYMKFHITHYPCEFWTRGAVHLHGHIHSGPKAETSEKTIFKPLRYDIGVDNNNYYPISYEQVKIIITKQLLGYKNE